MPFSIPFKYKHIKKEFRFMGNCPPTPPLTHVSALKSQVSEKHGLGVGRVGSFLETYLLIPKKLEELYIFSFKLNRKVKKQDFQVIVLFDHIFIGSYLIY